MVATVVVSPPPFDQPTNVVNLVSVNDGKILNVSLYSGRAEITRLYRFSVKTGQNQVNINGLPNVMDEESLRVEGGGAATIHDVTLLDIPKPDVPSTSTHLEDLLSAKGLAERALTRCRKGLASLESYLSTLSVQHTDVTDLSRVVELYDNTAEKLDRKVILLEKEIKKLDEDIKKERKTLTGMHANEKLGLRAEIVVFADVEGEVEIALIYAVEDATWQALYDIRVDMDSKEKSVKLIYKAAITQNTGEAWTDVPLNLETTSPTFGLGIPTLFPWNLFVYGPGVNVTTSKSRGISRSIRVSTSVERSGIMALLPGGRGDTPLTEQAEASLSTMEHRHLAVASKGGINATFRVPGTITIPSDGVSHNVTVVQLELDATMSWVAVPKVDIKTHLKARINNVSEYTLLPGSASVYVDGSFISRSNVPFVSPQESFDCPLGLDPSVRIVYHPLSRRVSQTFYNLNSTRVFTQRITIYNTKSITLNDFKVIDQIPISENSQITVKPLNPVLPSVAKMVVSKGGSRWEGLDHNNKPILPPPVKVGDGVIAQWEGADEPGFDVEALGKDGKFHWVCCVPSQGKVNLVLSWEVVAPASTIVVGL